MGGGDFIKVEEEGVDDAEDEAGTSTQYGGKGKISETTNQRLESFCVNQSEIRVVLSQPMRREYLPVFDIEHNILDTVTLMTPAVVVV